MPVACGKIALHTKKDWCHAFGVSVVHSYHSIRDDVREEKERRGGKEEEKRKERRVV